MWPTYRAKCFPNPQQQQQQQQHSLSLLSSKHIKSTFFYDSVLLKFLKRIICIYFDPVFPYLNFNGGGRWGYYALFLSYTQFMAPWCLILHIRVHTVYHAFRISDNGPMYIKLNRYSKRESMHKSWHHFPVRIFFFWWNMGPLHQIWKAQKNIPYRSNIRPAALRQLDIRYCFLYWGKHLPYFCTMVPHSVLI